MALQCLQQLANSCIIDMDIAASCGQELSPICASSSSLDLPVISKMSKWIRNIETYLD